MDEFAEDEKLGPEELQKKIDKTNRKLIKKRDELAFISNRVRVHDLGQDRYRRRYHHFAYAGGVFVEAVESCEPWKLETQGIVLKNSKSLFLLKKLVKIQFLEVDSSLLPSFYLRS